ncbi:cupin-like domain-containing protein [Lysobacter gummosus]|uniref:Cupin-like domain-containing protein n=1 Tax=Lysobacter gummosus TaxID=262324 RepID=A0ABY3XCF0_9GAMM|nr:cupin-like domain-containing protein [Lysobacter gummosus]ALN92604.1 cupin-like domain protein [Lysobacter gummosus]UNP28175.1 cupin-like domain-containing protein [Lysobacter gummosus]
MPPLVEAIEELHGIDAAALPPSLLHPTRPYVLRGVAANWPIARAGAASAPEAIGYLKDFARDTPVTVSVAPAQAGGRISYREDLQGFSFTQERAPLPVVLDTLLRQLDDPAAPTLYVGSTTIDTWLPGLRDHNDFGFGALQPLASIWIGNRTRIPAHQDVPDNIACVVAGRRRVTLFPPDQLQNLYIGPLDRTPAGQAVSLVDFAAPDYRHDEQRFPKFAEALRHAQSAELAPGDAVLIPSMWWHHIEALDAFNVLVNYWWRQSPKWMDTPMNALMLAIMSVRDLPPEQREVWREVFRHYVFDADAQTAAHIPEAARGMLAPIDELRARELRARLLQALNR